MARPRSFDAEDALARIKDVFWRLGYDGASMQDIEAATGLKKQSLYRLFGDKRGMYLRALEQYEAQELAAGLSLLAEPGSARARVARLLYGMIDAAIRGGDRRGCFICSAAEDQAQRDPETRTRVNAMIERLRGGFEAALAAEGPCADDRALRSRTAAELLAGYFGLRVLIRSGVDEGLLRAAASKILEGL